MAGRRFVSFHLDVSAGDVLREPQREREPTRLIRDRRPVGAFHEHVELE